MYVESLVSVPMSLLSKTTAVAELALGLIMDVARRVTAIDAMIRDGKEVTKLDGWSGQVSHAIKAISKIADHPRLFKERHWA